MPNVHCTYCGRYVRPAQRYAYVGYEENLLCPPCLKELYPPYEEEHDAQ